MRLATIITAFMANTALGGFWFTSNFNGMNVTYNDSQGVIGFGGERSDWEVSDVAKGVKRWIMVRASLFRYPVDAGYIRFPVYTDGIAVQYYRKVPSLFEVETVGKDSYIIAVETAGGNGENRLAWTVEQNSTSDKDLTLKLRPYERKPNQSFNITHIIEH